MKVSIDMKNFNNLLSREMTSGSSVVHGCVLAGIDKYETLFYTNISGYNAVGPDRSPLTLDTTFWIASCTKIFTIIAAMQCIERGLITLDEPIATVLPELRSPLIITDAEGESPPFHLRSATKKITLRHLLTYTSGLSSDYHPLLVTWRQSRHEAPRFMEGKVLDALEAPLLFEPGEAWIYGVGIDWMGVAVARLNNMDTLEDYFVRFLYSPLGLSSTTFRLEKRPDIQQRLIGTVQRQSDDGSLKDVPSLWPAAATEDSGGAGLYSTVPEFARVVGDLIRDRPILLKRETVDQMCTPQFEVGSTRLQSLVASKDALRAMIGDIDDASGLNWTIAGLTAFEDTGALKKGSVAGFGMPNLSWFINRECGIAAVFATQVFPPLDPICYGLAHRFFEEIWGSQSLICQTPIEV